MFYFLISSVVFTFTVHVHAMSLEKSIAFKETSCQVGTAKASLLLRFHKKMNPEENDFSGAPMLFLKSKKTFTIEPLAKPYPNDFSFVPVKESSSCTDTQGFELNENSIAILYTLDNRPFQDLHQVVVWDAKLEKILEKRELGAVVEYFKIKNGFAFSKMIPRSDGEEIAMVSSSGRKMTATDKDLNAFQTVTLNGNKLKVEFDPSLSYERSPWKKFFKNQNEFLKAAGWNSKKKTFQNIIVYEATSLNQQEGNESESCIAFADKRGGKFAPSAWKCLK